VPETLALDDAVALMADGRTALWLVDSVALAPGEWVLVEAAAGCVGTLLVQFAARLGAKVVATAGGAEKVARAEALGAALAVDYTVAGWSDRVRANGAVDVVLDGIGGEIARAAFDTLRPGGRMLSYGNASGRPSDVTPELAAGRDVTLVEPRRLTPDSMRAYTERALDAAAAGAVRPVIGQRFPLGGASAAHRAIETRATVGKTLLEVARSTAAGTRRER
jgi:NADPH:quinone reductase